VKHKWKILLGVVVVLVILGALAGVRRYRQSQIPVVQTGKVTRADLTSLVSASGEIKPRNYINIGANAMGRITNIYVKEGDMVRKGQILARLESIQAQAEVEATRAGISTAEAESAASEANVRSIDEAIATNEATLNRVKAEAERARIEFERGQRLYRENLVARAEIDQRTTVYNAQQAAVKEAEARILQFKAQKIQALQQQSASQRRIAQLRANLKRVNDVLDKFSATAPLDGMVTNLPVRVGETVVMGIQNSPGSNIMTIADMSVITAEVKVDETDIVNVRLGQIADVAIDAMPGKTFPGKVIEIGNTAILRSTGLAASQSQNSSQEAKDFKVVVALDAPPAEIRPGLSCTTKITTATRQNALAVPIQALTTRTKADLLPKDGNQAGKASVPGTVAADKSLREEVTGVFVIRAGKADFVKVETGITGTTEMEVTSGLKEGDEIVTGTFKVIKTLANGAVVRVDNKTPDKKPA
jgi:HlyD family secretion protein